MKIKAALFFLFLFFTLGFPSAQLLNQTPDTPKDEMINFDWLLGKWERTNNRPGSQIYEYWEKVSDSFYKGLGYTLKESDTVWQEKINLMQINDNWHYEVTVQNATNPVVFKLTEIESHAFSSENSVNDFPKKIRYEKVESGLRATISGGGKEIVFEFKESP